MEYGVLLRLFESFIIIGTAAAGFLLLNRFILFKFEKKILLPKEFHTGSPAIVYFYSDECIPCRYIQKAEIQKLSVKTGNSLQIIKIDTNDSPEIANKWGVLSLPTTFILDARGKAKHINHGVVKADLLYRQIKQVS